MQKIFNLFKEQNENFRVQSSYDWYASIILCNVLSILHGYKPFYGVNSEYNPVKWNKYFIVSYNWSSDGYRLPTSKEWDFIVLGNLKTKELLGIKTMQKLTTWENINDIRFIINGFSEWCNDLCSKEVKTNQTIYSKRIVKSISSQNPKKLLQTQSVNPTIDDKVRGFRIVRSKFSK